MDNVITFGFNRDFIDSLSERILACAQEKGIDAGDLSSVCVVFGGRRPQLFLKKALARRIGKPFVPPTFFSMDEFVSYTCAKTGVFGRAEALSSCFLLYTLAKKRLPGLLRNRDSFSRFLAWAREILNFIEQLDFEAIPEGPLKEIELSAAIGYEVPQSVNEILSHISLLRQGLHDSLRAQGVLTRGMAFGEAAAALEQGKAGFPEFSRVFFCNFFFLHSVERRIIRSLHRSGKAILVFQRDAADWPVLEQMEKELSISIPPDTGSPLTAELRIYGAFDAQSQAACCRQILRDLPMDERTVVVLPDPDALVPLLSETAAFAPELNVSLGYPVKRSPIFSLFELVSKAQLSRKGETYYSRDYLKAISHPLAKNLCQDPSVSRVLVHKVEEMLTGIITCDLSGTLFVDPRAVGSSAELFKEASRTLKNMGTQTSPEELSVILAELHRLLFFNWEKTDSFPDFSAACRDLLMQAVNTSPVESYPLNLMACNAVLDMLPLMENGSFDSERFGGEEIFRIFLSELENRTLSFTGSPLRGLQVLGLFETRSLNFENVVVLDVNEQALPMLRIYEPLIPREVMLALGLNRIEKEDEIQRYQFFRLVRGARRVHLICSSGSDKEKSRFLEELIWERQRVSGSLESGTPAVAFTVKIQPGKKEARKTPEMIKTLAGLTYSSSSLNTYLMCPMRFYYQYMLRLDEKTDLLDETEAKDVGTFCHDLLETAFAPFVGKKPVIDPPFRERFQALFEERFSRVFERTLRPDAFLLKEILKVRLNAFLDKEEGRPVSQIVCLEGKNDETLEIDGKKYSFTWRVDRVDRIDDGSLLVIDYKSGGADLKPASMRTIIARGWERQQLKKTLKSIQLPMYLYFTARRFPGTPVNACLYSLRSSTITTLLKPGALQEEGEVEQVFLSSLGALLGEIVDAQRPFACDDSNPQYCSICPFACLCR